MSSKENYNDSANTGQEDVFANSQDWVSSEIPTGVDRRAFLMKSAVVGAAVMLTGSQLKAKDLVDRSTPPARSLPLWSSKYVASKEEVMKGPVMTLCDEFYKVGP